MKKIFTFFVALMMTSLTFAQMHGAMHFVGDAGFSAATVSGEQKSDTLKVELGNSKAGTFDKITIPDIVYNPNMVIKSFTIDGLSYTMVGTYPNMYFEWNVDSFTATTIGTDGQEKQITGSSLLARYYHTANKFSLTAVFSYGGMPMEITYNMDAAFYVKSVSMPITVNVANTDYVTAGAETYKLRKYVEDNTEKVDIEFPTYSLSGTPMGDLTVGTYTVKGLVYDEEKGGYFRDYSNDGITFHFKTSTGIDKDYGLYADGTSVIVQYSGNNVTYIENNFRPGTMPFPIIAISGEKPTAVEQVEAETQAQPVKKSYKAIENGKLVIVKEGKKFDSAGQQL
jgi:hypothetical protein